MPDAIFSHPRLAHVYDALDGDRNDLTTYTDLVTGAKATEVLDVGCGTGTLACLLADEGVVVVGVDPAAASVAVARSRQGADAVTWIVGTASDVAADPANHQRFQFATMTANVAQVFLDDTGWVDNLRTIRACLGPGGQLVFETRVPADRAWERWTKQRSHQVIDTGAEGLVERWIEVTAVDGDLIASSPRRSSTQTANASIPAALCASAAKATCARPSLRPALAG